MSVDFSRKYCIRTNENVDGYTPNYVLKYFHEKRLVLS